MAMDYFIFNPGPFSIAMSVYSINILYMDPMDHGNCGSSSSKRNTPRYLSEAKTTKHHGELLQFRQHKKQRLTCLCVKNIHLTCSISKYIPTKFRKYQNGFTGIWYTILTYFGNMQPTCLRIHFKHLCIYFGMNLSRPSSFFHLKVHHQKGCLTD